jgi:hypothetical protein
MIQFLGPIANIATTWLEGRQEKAKAKQQLEVAKVHAQVKRVEQDGSWEEKAYYFYFADSCVFHTSFTTIHF